MISAQIDELRKWADLYDGTAKPALSAELQRPYLAHGLRDAADTIQQLRDDLQRANEAVRDAEHDESRAWDRVRKAEAEADRLREQGARLFDKTLELGTENDRLRELVRDLYEMAYPECPSAFEAAFADRMRELGAEVEE